MLSINFHVLVGFKGDHLVTVCNIYLLLAMVCVSFLLGNLVYINQAPNSQSYNGCLTILVSKIIWDHSALETLQRPTSWSFILIDHRFP